MSTELGGGPYMSSQKQKRMKLGDVEIVDIGDELNFDDVYMDGGLGFAGGDNPDMSAYAFYGTTSGCSDSCGSSTFCC